MVVTYCGEGCFRLQSGDTSLLVDPISARLKTDVVVKTLVPAAPPPSEPGEIGFPGEYEIKGMEIQGWQVEEESTAKFLKTVYLVRWEEMTFAFLGHISRPPHGDLLQNLNEPDVLIVPAGGDQFLRPADAAQLVKQLEPSIVIPSFVKKPADIAKTFGEKIEPLEKLVFKKKDLVKSRTRLVLLGNAS